MKRLVEDFDDMMNIEDEVSVEDTKSPLEKELIRVYEYLKDKGETDIKAYEVAYQEAIENIYPENSWWEVIDLNIFWDLFENQNPRTTIDNIISSIKPEFKKEVIDTVVTEDIEEENPLKDIRSNIIEFPNGEYVYVEYADGKLYAGSATNRGIIHEYEMDYDKDFDVDRNLQNFFDKIIEENPELGEPLDESKKVCEDTVKQDNKWVNKGKDGTHGTFRTKKAADAQRKAMFANKGKKSTFGESFKVGDTFTNAGEEWEILRSEGDYSLVYAKDRKFYPYVVAYRLDDDGTWAQGHYFSDKDSAEKFLMNETGSVNESKQRRRGNRCVTEAKQEKLSKKTKAKRIYESMKRKHNKLKESRLSDNSSTNFKDLPSEGYVYTYCDECGKKNRVKVTFNSFKEPFNDTEYKCEYCGTHNMLTDPHKYDENGYVIESSQSYLDRVEELMNQGLDEETASREAYAEFHPDEYDADDYDEGYESMKRKPKKNLKEAADDEIRLFMNTWANYNENGADDGITPTGWMSLDESEEYAEKYAEYEPFINDTENVPEELGVNEYSGVSETIGMLRDYEGFDDEQREVFAAFIDEGYNVDEAFRIVDIGDYVYVQGYNDTELAETYIDEIGGIEALDRDTLERYFDFDAFGRDLAYDFIETENGYVNH